MRWSSDRPWAALSREVRDGIGVEAERLAQHRHVTLAGVAVA